MSCVIHMGHQTGAGVDEEEEELYDDHEEADRVKYQETLDAIGAFGRHVPHHTIPLMVK